MFMRNIYFFAYEAFKLFMLTCFNLFCSLNYAFIEYVDKECAEQAYFKMNNVLIDDRLVQPIFF
jgi:hypothetical protein